ncbi:MAG: hypothetical protein IJY10_03010 [Lachnospiraceae bacterium]|nr:hypothetical protein [Lachnospiraceae bacterium]
MAAKKVTPGREGYKILFDRNTVIMNYKFSAAAAKYGTPENMLLKNIRNDFPGMVEVVVSGREQTQPRPNHRLTYKNMEKYIGACSDSQKLLKEFAVVKEQSKTALSPYKYVSDWFVKKFPNYKTAIKEEKNKEDGLQKVA